MWFEITTLLIPGQNDSDAELDAMTRWVVEHLGPDVPHALHRVPPDFKMLDVARDAAGDADPRAGASRTRNGVRHVYTGNVHDPDGGSTYCPGCGALVIDRDWYEIGERTRSMTGAVRAAAPSRAISTGPRERGGPGACRCGWPASRRRR